MAASCWHSIGTTLSSPRRCSVPGRSRCRRTSRGLPARCPRTAATTRPSSRRTTARWRRRRPDCISRRRCSQALEQAWRAARHDHAACRRRHLPAGAHRRRRAAPHACRTRRDHAASRRCDQRRARAAVVAVGTTSLRLLESAASDDGCVRPFAGDTTLFIVPGYRFRAVDLLLTNFHLPRSTLFMLVCAFAGTERMRAAYAHAIEAGYRFYSYGDACLLDWRGMWDRELPLPIPLPQGEGENHCDALLPSHHRHRRRRARRPAAHRAWRRADTSLHAGRHGRHSEGDDRGCGARYRHDHRAGQHLPPDAAARRGARRPSRRSASLHGLARTNPDGLRRLPGHVAGQAAQARRRRRDVPVASGRLDPSPDAGALDRDPAPAGCHDHHGAGRVHPLPRHARRSARVHAIVHALGAAVARGVPAAQRLRPVRHRAGQRLSGAARSIRARAAAHRLRRLCRRRTGDRRGPGHAPSPCSMRPCRIFQRMRRAI